MRKIGFVGLGMMGEPMAANLLKAGFEVLAHDVRPEPVVALQGQGATAAQSLAELAACDAAIVMVNTEPQAREVIGELVERSQRRPYVIVSMSTILPSTIRDLGEKAAAAGIGLLDAPVSGGPAGAQLGALAIMVGGDPALFAGVRPLLEAMGRSITHVGPLGAGLAMKLVNNMIFISVVPVVAQALRVGIEQGLEFSTMLEVLKASSGNTWLTDQWEQARMALAFLLRDPAQLEALVKTGVKDLELVAALCEESGLDALLVRHAMQGLGPQDVGTLRSTLARVLEASQRE
jgi:3-hydroxyisobutyrate dehydrogenase-like beta-hydroxyacid dehydrogenase